MAALAKRGLNVTVRLRTRSVMPALNRLSDEDWRQLCRCEAQGQAQSQAKAARQAKGGWREAAVSVSGSNAL